MHPRIKEYLDEVVIRDGEKWIDGDVLLCCYSITELNFHDININGQFNCSYTNITTLKGSPKTVNEYFGCSFNKLTSLEGAPMKINGDFACYNNNITSLKGLGDVEGLIYLNKPLNCDYFIQYSLMGKICLID